MCRWKRTRVWWKVMREWRLYIGHSWFQFSVDLPISTGTIHSGCMKLLYTTIILRTYNMSIYITIFSLAYYILFLWYAIFLGSLILCHSCILTFHIFFLASTNSLYSKPMLHYHATLHFIHLYHAICTSLWGKKPFVASRGSSSLNFFSAFLTLVTALWTSTTT